MSVRHIHAKPGQYIAVHRVHHPNKVRSQSSDNIWLTLVYIAGGIAVIVVGVFLLYSVISWLLGWLLPLLILAIPGYFVCQAMGSSRPRKR